MKHLIYFSTAGLGLALLGSCGPQQPVSNAAPQPYPVTTLTPAATQLHMDYPATVRGQQNIEIRPKVDGYVAQILVDEGASVKKGQLLFKISAPQYEQEVITAQAAIKSAEAAVNNASMQVRKTLPLVKKEIISEFDLEAAQLALQAKEAALAQAKAALQNARVNLGYTTIYSPADGVIGSLPYKIGSLVNSSSVQPLTMLSDISNIHAYFSFTEQQFLELISSAGHTTTEEALKKMPAAELVLANGNMYTEKGKIEATGGQINTGTGAISMRATFSNKAGLIHSGSSATIRITQPVSNAMIVPAKATYEMQGKKFVFTVDTSGTAHVTEIQVGALPAGDAFIVTRGLKAGDRIITEGIGSLKEGDKIKPVTHAVTAAR